MIILPHTDLWGRALVDKAKALYDIQHQSDIKKDVTAVEIRAQLQDMINEMETEKNMLRVRSFRQYLIGLIRLNDRHLWIHL